MSSVGTGRQIREGEQTQSEEKFSTGPKKEEREIIRFFTSRTTRTQFHNKKIISHSAETQIQQSHYLKHFLRTFSCRPSIHINQTFQRFHAPPPPALDIPRRLPSDAGTFASMSDISSTIEKNTHKLKGINLNDSGPNVDPQNRRTEVNPEPAALHVDLDLAADDSADTEREAHASVQVPVDLTQGVCSEDGYLTFSVARMVSVATSMYPVSYVMEACG